MDILAYNLQFLCIFLLTTYNFVDNGCVLVSLLWLPFSFIFWNAYNARADLFIISDFLKYHTISLIHIYILQ